MRKTFGVTNKRYQIQAKRKGVGEKWSEWTNEDHFEDAVAHVKHIKNDLGHCGRVVPHEGGVRELWNILGMELSVTEKADAIFDAGFRLQEESARIIFSSINRAFNKRLRALNEEINLLDEVGNEGVALELKKQRAVLENAFELLHAIEKCYVKEKDDERNED